MCSTANRQGDAWLLSHTLLCTNAFKCIVTIAFVNVGDHNVLLVHGGPLGIMGVVGRGTVYMRRVSGIVLS